SLGRIWHSRFSDQLRRRRGKQAIRQIRGGQEHTGSREFFRALHAAGHASSLYVRRYRDRPRSEGITGRLDPRGVPREARPARSGGVPFEGHGWAGWVIREAAVGVTPAFALKLAAGETRA